MRKSTVRAIQVAVQESNGPLDRGMRDMRDAGEALADAIELLAKEVRAIEPASVDLTQEMADDIVRKMHGPLTIPMQVSEWARKEASYHDMQAFHRIGYSPDALEAIWQIKGNGTLSLELRYPDGSRAWIGTFVPPGFGVQ